MHLLFSIFQAMLKYCDLQGGGGGGGGAEAEKHKGSTYEYDFFKAKHENLTVEGGGG